MVLRQRLRRDVSRSAEDRENHDVAKYAVVAARCAMKDQEIAVPVPMHANSPIAGGARGGG